MGSTLLRPCAAGNNPSAAALDPRGRSHSSVPRHTPQTAIHYPPKLGDPYRLPAAEVNLSKYLILNRD
jgi:hypothetical protein